MLSIKKNRCFWFFLLEYLPNKFGLTTKVAFKKRSKALKRKGVYKTEILCYKDKNGDVHKFYQWGGFKWENVEKKQIKYPQTRRTK